MTVPSPQPEYIPATPLAGTGTSDTLVSPGEYAKWTGDATTAGTDVAAAIAEAVEQVAARCNRTLLFGEYTERLYVNRKGFVYPSAVPIAQVVAPAGSTPQGYGVWVGMFLPLPEMPVFSGMFPPQTDLTYWGGFNNATIPPRLARAIAKVAWFLLHPTSQPGMPPRATSVAGGGGVTVGGDLSQMLDSDPALDRLLRRFTRPAVHGWQS